MRSGRTAFSRYPLPKSLPSGEGLAAEAALRACRPCRFAPVCVFPLFCTREVFWGAPVCVSARFYTRDGGLSRCLCVKLLEFWSKIANFEEIIYVMIFSWFRKQTSVSPQEDGSLKDLYSRFPDYSALTPEDEDQFDDLLTQLFIDYFGRVSTLRRHEVLASWNYDFPKAILEWVVSQADTDIATAQMIYWRMEPESVRDYEVEEDLPIVETVEQRIGQGFYQDNGWAYDPRNDNGCNEVKSNTDSTPEDFYPPELLKARTGRHIEGIQTNNAIPEELYPAFARLVKALGLDFYLE